MCRTDLGAELLYLSFRLSLGRVTHEDVRCSYLLSKLLECQDVMCLFHHGICSNKSLVGDKYLATSITPKTFGLSGGIHCVGKETVIDMPVSHCTVIRHLISR